MVIFENFPKKYCSFTSLAVLGKCLVIDSASVPIKIARRKLRHRTYKNIHRLSFDQTKTNYFILAISTSWEIDIAARLQEIPRIRAPREMTAEFPSLESATIETCTPKTKVNISTLPPVTTMKRTMIPCPASEISSEVMALQRK